MKFMGKHCILDATGILYFESLQKICVEAARISGATVLNVVVTPFEGGGESIVITLSESHLTVHTYPEYGSAFFDIFTCGIKCEPSKALEHIKKSLNCVGTVTTINRGEYIID